MGNSVLLKPTDSVNFWKSEDIVDLGFKIPFMAKPGVDQRGRWPGGYPPDWDIIEKELAVSRSAYIEVNRMREGDGIRFKLLTGRFVLAGSVWRNNDGNNRLTLNKNNGIEFASNKLRSTMAIHGIHVKHDGIYLISPNDYRLKFEQSNSLYRSGTYLDRIMEHARTSGEDSDFDFPLAEEVATLSENEEHLLKTLETYIDGEYELEQQIARSEMGFTYVKVAPEPRKSTVRKFYRLTILDQDFSRMRDGKHSMVSAVASDGQDILLQIEDMDANVAKSEIIVSTVQQLSAGQFPECGQLKLVALDTLLKVRKGVVDNLRNGMSRNPWLVKVASECYKHEPVKPVSVSLPPSEFPPNPSQVKAINSGAGTPDYMLVLGPPGTGKTTVIYNWVEHFVSQGKRILISSQNNKAVDNVLERVAKNEELTCVRLGNESKVSSGIHHLLIDNCATDLQKRLMATLDERMASVTEVHKLVHELLDKLTSDAPAERVVEVAEKTKCYVQENVAQLASFAIGTESDGIMASISKLKHTSDQYQSIVAKQDEYTTKKGWLMPFYRIGALWQKFKGKKVLNQTLLEKKQLHSQMNEKTKQLDQLFNEISVWNTNISNVRQESLYPILLKLVDVVGATCIGINTSSFFKDTEFDVVIIDESGQIQLHNLIVPLSKAKHVILVGDHKQLPPVVSEELKVEVQSRAEAEFFEVSTEMIDKSWFEILWNRAPDDRKVMLDTQFRCPAVISDYISEAFYDGKYFAGEPMKKKQPIFSFYKSTMAFLDTSKLPAADRSEQSRKNGTRNEVLGNRCETKIVIQLLHQVLNEKPDLGLSGEIGIIVPYANHVQEIQRAIATEQKQGRLTELATPVTELVASVDSYQGQERDLIIFLFTRSNKMGSVGFLADWRRLNVAMTRAKKQLVMIGDFSTLAAKPREGAVDYEFKIAMKKLQTFISTKCHLITLTGTKNEDDKEAILELNDVVEDLIPTSE